MCDDKKHVLGSFILFFVCVLLTALNTKSAQERFLTYITVYYLAIHVYTIWKGVPQ